MIHIESKQIASFIGEQAQPEDAAPGKPAEPPEPTEPAEPEQAVAYQFAHEAGGHWLIRYEGRKIGLFPDALGFCYIHELIRNQGRSIPAVRLREHSRRAPAAGVVTSGELAEDADLREALGDGEMADERTVAKVQEFVAELEQRKAGCENPHEAAELGEQLEAARKYLSSVTGLFGRSRPMSGSARKNAMDAVRSAIRSAVSKIEDCDRPCGLHFHQNISYGASPLYSPSPAVDWQLF